MYGTARNNRRHSGPRWKEIETVLADDIVSGRFASGDQLPTESDLARRFEVNRHTVRRAVAALVDRGLVNVHQGRGMFVPHLPIDYAIGPTTRFTANIIDAHKMPQRADIEITRKAADDQTAKALKIRKGATVVVWRSTGLADKQPVVVSNRSFPASRLEGIEEALRSEQGITQALKRVGIDDYVRQSTRIFAAMPSPEEAEILRQSTRRPVLITEAIDADLKGTPISFGHGIFAGERVQLTV